MLLHMTVAVNPVLKSPNAHPIVFAMVLGAFQPKTSVNNA